MAHEQGLPTRLSFPLFPIIPGPYLKDLGHAPLHFA